MDEEGVSATLESDAGSETEATPEFDALVRAVDGGVLGVAAHFDTTPATFTQHLRTAERKRLEAALEQVPASG